MMRWHRAAIDLRYAITKRSLLLPTSSALYSTSSPLKVFSKPTTPPQKQQSPKSRVKFNTPSAQMDKTTIFEAQVDKTVVDLDELKCPKPCEIPWQAKVSNFVNLIGHIKMPVQFRTDDNGKKTWAASVISQEKETSSKSSPLRMPVLFEGDLAHVVACHVKENDYVYVTGHLSAQPSPFSPSTTAQSLQIIVESINFVDEPSFIKKKVSHVNPKDDSKKKDQPFKDDASGKTYDASLGPWADLLDEPKLWRDFRKDKQDGKVSPKHPDFKRKEGSVSLWLDRAPKYILSELNNLDFAVTVSQLPSQQAKRNKGEESWKDLVENPHQWSDNRSKKRSEKAPDFTRKDTREGLWLDSAPKSIMSALGNVDFGDQTPVKANIVKEEESWKDVVKNPSKWWDNRCKKLNNKSPDFKHKETGESLWLTKAPSWVPSKLPPSKATPSFGSQT